MIRKAAAIALHNPAFTRFLDVLESRQSPNRNLLRVLTYHRVLPRPEKTSVFSPGMEVNPQVFEQHMSYLADHYHAISVTNLHEYLKYSKQLPSSAVLVTFDDAYSDFAEYAWPVLKRFRIPVTLFVPTAFPDQPDKIFWWDWLSAAFQQTGRTGELTTAAGRYPMATEKERVSTYRQIRDYIKTLPHSQVRDFIEGVGSQLNVPRPAPSILGWDQLRQLAEEGVSLGAHSQTHPLLNRISIEEVRKEAAGALRDLERETGSVLPIFAYPGGEINDDVVRALKGEGVELGFTTVRGINDLEAADPLKIKRINIGQRTSLPILRTQLLTQAVPFYRYF